MIQVLSTGKSQTQQHTGTLQILQNQNLEKTSPKDVEPRRNQKQIVPLGMIQGQKGQSRPLYTGLIDTEQTQAIVPVSIYSMTRNPRGKFVFVKP